MNHNQRRVTVGGADSRRITEDPTPLVRAQCRVRRLAEEGEVE